MKIRIEGEHYGPRPTRMVFLRHGESEANLGKQIAGFTDVQLTDTGREQARNAGTRISRFSPIDNVLSSPRVRALESAYCATGVEPEVVEELAERHFGDAEMQLVTPRLISFLTGPYRDRYSLPFAPGGESDNDIMNRWDRFCDQRGPELQGQTTVLAGHASTMETLWSDLNLIRSARPKRFGNASIYVAEVTGNPRTPDFSVIHTSGIVYARTAA